MRKTWTTTLDGWMSIELSNRCGFSTKYRRKYVNNTGSLPNQQKKKKKNGVGAPPVQVVSPSLNYKTFQICSNFYKHNRGKGCFIRLESCHVCSRG